MNYKRWIIPALFVIAAVLRLWHYGQAQLWYDESFTRLVARLDLSHLVDATAGDVHPPLWYLIEWIVIRLLGESPWAMRLPSILASMWGLWLTYRLGQRLGITRPALIAAVGFMAINATQIWYAQEARMYQLLQALVLVAVLAVLDRRWWALWLAMTGLLWIHNYGGIYCLVIGLWALWREREEQLNFWIVILTGGLALLSWMPWVWVLYMQMTQVANGYWIPAIRAGTVIWALSAALWSFVMDAPFDAVAPLVMCGALTLAMIRSIQRREHGLLAWLALAPLAVVVVLSALWKPILLYRGLIASMPALVLWLSEVLVGDRQPVLYRWIAAVIVMPILITSQFTLWTTQWKKGNDANIVTEYIMPNYTPGTQIVHINDGSIIVFLAHMDLPQYEVDSGCPDPLGSLSPVTRATLGIQRVTLQQARARGRVILIGGVGATSSACEEAWVHQAADGADQQVVLQTEDVLYTGVWIYEH